MEKRTIIGIDPGTNLLGFGVIEIDGGRPAFVDMGVLDLRKEKDAYSKLRQIFDTVSEVVRTYHGTEMALESPFYGKNVQVVLKLGRAQGAAMIAAMEQGLPVFEYAPRQAKQAITGNGGAAKEQVSLMLEKTLGFHLETEHLDATDALAIAMCHYYSTTNPVSSVKKGSSGWEKYILEHPEKVK